MDELVYGVFRPESVTCLQLVIRRMKDENCDAVVLGCTEIPLVIGNKNSPLPTLDSTRLLAWAALKRSVADPVSAVAFRLPGPQMQKGTQERPFLAGESGESTTSPAAWQ